MRPPITYESSSRFIRSSSIFTWTRSDHQKVIRLMGPFCVLEEVFFAIRLMSLGMEMGRAVVIAEILIEGDLCSSM